MLKLFIPDKAAKFSQLLNILFIFTVFDVSKYLSKLIDAKLLKLLNRLDELLGVLTFPIPPIYSSYNPFPSESLYDAITVPFLSYDASHEPIASSITSSVGLNSILSIFSFFKGPLKNVDVETPLLPIAKVLSGFIKLNFKIVSRFVLSGNVVMLFLYFIFIINSFSSPEFINSFNPIPSNTYSVLLLFFASSSILSIHIATVPLFCTFTLYEIVEFTCVNLVPIVTVSLLYLLV